MDIEKVRSYFCKHQGEDSQIADATAALLSEIDKRKNGTTIGKHVKHDYLKMLKKAKFPAKSTPEDKVILQIAALYDNTGNWAHPQMQVNVVPPPTRVSIACSAVAARFNENSIWDHYGTSAAVSEVKAIGMLADLIGFPKSTVGGVFTFGGTGCNLYAARIGIEKADPDAKSTGIRDRVKIFCSELAHYSIKSAAIWTGLGMDNVVTIPSTDDNIMDVKVLEKEMKSAIHSGARIGTIYATMGTTDAFGIDPLRDIVKVRDRVQKKVRYKIHVHADAVIGWPYLTFKKSKKLSVLNERTRKEVRAITKKMAALKYADSVGIDFHKTGWTPYLCSVIMVRDKKDLMLLTKSKKDMPYLYHGSGYQPGTFTLESSRPNYAQKALANMLALGKEGYEDLIVHLLSTADYLRDRMATRQDISVMNSSNPAFVTDFRLYPIPVDDPHAVFVKELHDQTPKGFTSSVNEYNRKIAQKMIENAEKKGTSMISYTDVYKTTKRGRCLVALKSYPMSPFTDKEHMDVLLKDLDQAMKDVAGRK